MWKNRSGKMLQITEFGFGIGSILAPVIMKPYLVGEIGSGADKADKLFTSYINGQGIFGADDDISADDRRNRLMWPTLITGACIIPSKCHAN